MSKDNIYIDSPIIKYLVINNPITNDLAINSPITNDLVINSPIGIETIGVIYSNGIVTNAIFGEIAVFDFDVIANFSGDVVFTVDWGVQVGETIINTTLVSGVSKPLQTSIEIPEGVDTDQTINVTDSLVGSYEVPYTVESALPTLGLEAYYPFNGNADDESGNGNDGIVNNAVLTTGRKGDANGAYLFSDSSDDYIDISSIGHLPTLTISLWAKWISGGNQGVLWKGNIGQTGNYQVTVEPGATPLANRFTVNGVFRESIVGLDTSWRNIVFIYNAATQTAKYIINDGTTVTTSIASLDNTGLKIYLGQYFNSTASFNGSIDDVRFYNRELSADEITELYNE